MSEIRFPVVPLDQLALEHGILFIGDDQEVKAGREEVEEAESKGLRLFLIRQAWEWDALEPEWLVFV